MPEDTLRERIARIIAEEAKAATYMRDYGETADRILAELGMMWRPIAEAPRFSKHELDGDFTGELKCDPLDLWSPETHSYVAVGRYCPFNDAWEEDGSHAYLNPTHWRLRPLPPAPEVK